jgi:hypothetical protein
MPNASPLIEPKSACARSRVSNHNDLLPNIDGRSAQARRYRDVLAACVSDQGGLDRMSESRLQLIRRFSALCVIAEGLEGQLVSGGSIEIQAFATLSSTLVRLASRLGIDRRSKLVSTPSLRDYLEGKAEEVDE